ncbi:MAG: hypothetical protein ACT4OS_12310 [Acidimicrobiales bacterium]
MPVPAPCPTEPADLSANPAGTGGRRPGAARVWSMVAVAALVLSGCSRDPATRSTPTSTRTAPGGSAAEPGTGLDAAGPGPGGSDGPTTTVDPDRPTTSAPGSPDPAATATTSPGVVLSAVVAATFASARVLALAEPVNGVSEVVFDGSTRLTRVGGASASLADLRAGTRVEITGRANPAGGFVASAIVIS